MKELSLYIHIPFCEKKCDYCDFVSAKCEKDWIDKYVLKLTTEINEFDASGYIVDSIFIGGGTPTLLEPKQFKSIVDCIKAKFKIDLKEFTVEGNPNSYTQEKVDFYKSQGVTRLSVGVQSLNDKVLKGIGRIHTAKQAEDCLQMLCKSGLDINCDFMVGLPYQTLDIVKSDIQKIVEFGVTSVSCYSLILEENTPLFNKVQTGEIKLPDDDIMVDMYDIAVKILQKSGLRRYEISNFGKPCYHNIGYWRLKEYAGFGIASHSLINNIRYYNTENFEKYMSGIDYREVEEVLSESDLQKEYVMLALRMENGILIGDFINKFGSSAYSKLLEDIDKDKIYYNITKNNIAIKPEYIYMSNSLIANLI